MNSLGDDPCDQEIRRKLFWIVLAMAVGLVSSGFIIEKNVRYSLLTYSGIKFGYTGFQLARIPSREEVGGKKRIVLLGNSVYQYNGIPQYMQQIADKENSQLVFMNMAQVGTSIYDYLVQTAKVVSSKPDLIVLCSNPGTFSFARRFSTDGEQFVFDPDVLKVMPALFYFQCFTYQTAIDSFLSTLIPLKRVDPLIRWKFRLYDRLPKWVFKWLSYPILSIKWGGDVKTVQMTQLAQTAGEEKFIVLQEVLDLAQEHKIPVLFIWQESKERVPLEYTMIRKQIEYMDNALFIDLASYWDRWKFVDSIHPAMAEEPNYARRHYNAVNKALAFFKHKKQREQGR